jgi:hypothetical protein
VLPGFFQTTNNPNNPAPLPQLSTHTLQSASLAAPSASSATPSEAGPNPAEEPLQIVVNKVPDFVSLKDSHASKSLCSSIEKEQVIDFIKPRCPDLITEDVLNNRSFISAMAHSLPKIRSFLALEDMYSCRQSKKANKTELSKSIDEIKGGIKILDEKLKEASQIKIDISQGTERLCIASTQKQMVLTQVTTRTLEIRHLIETTNIARKIKKRIVQQSQRKERGNTFDEIRQPETILQCYNSKLSWENSYAGLENNEFSGKVSSSKISHVAAQIESCFIYQVSGIEAADKDEREHIVNILLSYFPIMRATRNCNIVQDVLIDANQLVLDPECFAMLFKADESPVEPADAHCDNQDQAPKPVKEGPTRRLGRQPLWLKFPSIVETATSFIKQQSFAAHNRRRESTGTGTGVTLKDLQQQLIDNVPGLKQHGISRDTIHHLMVAPKKNSSRADRYKGHIDAKVTAKRNDYREGSANQHFLFARVNYREELCAMFSDEARFYSSDDMNKLRMGPSPAVSRYHQQHRFYMKDNAPNLWDHDFPNPGYLLTTSGYQMQSKRAVYDNQLEDAAENELYGGVDQNDYSVDPDSVTEVTEPPITAECSVQPSDEEIYLDKLGRPHYKKTTYGPAVLVLRAGKFTSSSGQTHTNDLLPILSAQVKDGKTVAFIKVDNGSDWNIRSLVNSIYLCRLWKDSGLDILGVVSYAAKYSAYNQIEHLWSPMSKKLSSVILPSILEGENSPPYLQKGLQPDEVRLKEAAVFDRAMMLIRDQYWKEATFNGNEITTVVKPCLEKETPYDDYDHVHKVIRISILFCTHVSFEIS